MGKMVQRAGSRGRGVGWEAGNTKLEKLTCFPWNMRKKIQAGVYWVWTMVQQHQDHHSVLEMQISLSLHTDLLCQKLGAGGSNLCLYKSSRQFNAPGVWEPLNQWIAEKSEMPETELRQDHLLIGKGGGGSKWRWRHREGGLGHLM